MYILASTSPRRREIFEKFNLTFKVVSSSFDESTVNESNPYLLSEKLALGKALDISKDYPNNIVIGADTIVVVNDEVIGKPVDFDDAFSILKKLSGHYQEVVTGVAIIKGEKKHIFHAISEIIFRDLSDDEIIDYINTGEPFGKAGAYAIQENAGGFVKTYKGEFENIVGFPIKRFLEEIKRLEDV